MNWAEEQARFRLRILAAANHSRDGMARMVHATGQLSGLVSDGDCYWFINLGEGGLLPVRWDFVYKNGHRKCAANSWIPNVPLSPLEKLAKALDEGA